MGLIILVFVGIVLSFSRDGERKDDLCVLDFN